MNVTRHTVQSVAAELQKEFTSLKREIARLNDEIKKRDARIDILEIKTDDLEQYTLTNSIHITNIPESDGEKTNEVIVKVAEAIGAKIDEKIIDQSHRIGSKRANGTPRAIIIKFVSYRGKREMTENKKKLGKVRGEAIDVR